MIDKDLLRMLVCPENRTPLHSADDSLIGQINRAISAGTLKNRTGQTVDSQIEDGLVREDGALLYPVVDGIPVLLIDEAIPLDQVGPLRR